MVTENPSFENRTATPDFGIVHGVPLASVLARPINPNLSLFGNPSSIDITRAKTDKGYRYAAVLNGPKGFLTKPDFYNLLGELSPLKSGYESYGGVVGDWVAYGASRRENPNQFLAPRDVSHSRAFGTLWDINGAHMPQLITLFSGRDDTEQHEYESPQRLLDRIVTHQEAYSAFISRHTAGSNGLGGLFADVPNLRHRDEIGAILKQHPEYVHARGARKKLATRTPRQAYRMVFKIPRDLQGKVLDEYLAHLYGVENTEKINQIITGYSRQQYGFSFTTSDGKTHYVRKVGNDETVQASQTEDGIELAFSQPNKRLNAAVVVDIEDGTKKLKRYDYTHPEISNYVVPTLYWSTEGGQRELLLGGVNEHPYPEAFVSHTQDLANRQHLVFGSEKFDTLAGYAALMYLYPEIYKTWKPYMNKKAEESDVSKPGFQLIMRAQVTLRMLMAMQELMNQPFFDSAERITNSLIS